jgi:hypothetical protein
MKVKKENKILAEVNKYILHLKPIQRLVIFMPKVSNKDPKFPLNSPILEVRIKYQQKRDNREKSSKECM